MLLALDRFRVLQPHLEGNESLTSVERILEVNSLREVTKAVMQAARDSLVIGQA